MYPVIFALGPITISSFGLFLALALMAAIFTIWRVVRVYDLDPEKVVDIILIDFFFAFIGARIFFVALNPELFDSINKMFLINQYPGLSFWGGLTIGVLTLWMTASRFMNMNFWQMADLGAVGLSIGLVLGNIGCFLGGCAYGIVSDSPLAYEVIGQIGRRFPIALVESLACLMLFWYLWKQIIRFHWAGKIAVLFMIFYGLIRFCLEFYMGDRMFLAPSLDSRLLSVGSILSFAMIVIGIVFFYKRSKRKLTHDIKLSLKVLYSSRRRREFVYNLNKICYNQFVSARLGTGNFLRKIFVSPAQVGRRLNVKVAPKNRR